MAISAAEAKLQQIPIEEIDRNPENPRLVFRSGELEELLESIRIYGVQVPISVFREHGRYVLIDGERRWRCALKLNYNTIPALVQQKPTVLENLLLMFNIHALREQWDLLTIALKLPRIIQLLTDEFSKAPTEREISEKSGLGRAIIRRSKLLMNLPQRYKDQILTELEKPKSQQKITEDLFIELERALTTAERSMPDVVGNRDRARRVLLKKFKSGIINNRVAFRDMARIARAERVGGDVATAARELGKLLTDNDYSIERAYENSVGNLYTERNIETRVSTLLNLLDDVEISQLDSQTRTYLRRLLKRIQEILGADI
jgi:ParB family chromosome partitioning protein